MKERKTKAMDVETFKELFGFGGGSFQFSFGTWTFEESASLRRPSRRCTYKNREVTQRLAEHLDIAAWRITDIDFKTWCGHITLVVVEWHENPPSWWDRLLGRS